MNKFKEPHCPNILNIVQDYLEELKNCEKIFKTQPRLEIFAPNSEDSSSAEDVNYGKIAELMIKQIELISLMDIKLSEMHNSLKIAESFSDEMEMKNIG